MHSKEKIKKIRERALLREYLALRLSKVIIKEQDDGYYGGYDDIGVIGGYSSPGPGSSDVTTFLSKSDFARLLGLDSIHNAFRAATGGIKSIAAKAFGETRILVKSLFWYLMPTFLKSSKFNNIIEMAEQEREIIDRRLEEINREYADVIEKNKEVFTNPDFNFAFFVAAPGAVIGTDLVNKALGTSVELFDSMIGADKRREDIGDEIGKFFSELTSKIGLDPNDANDRREIERRIFQQLKEEFPNLTLNELHSVIGEVRQNLITAQGELEEQAIPARATSQQISPEQQNKQNRIDAFLTTPEGNDYIKAIGASMQKLKNYISSPVAQQKMNNSSVAKAGQEMLVNNIVQAATDGMNKFNANYIKTNYQKEIEEFFNKNGITDPKEKESLINNPEVAKEIEKLIKDTLKSAYIKQLDELEKINPSTLKFAVANGKKQIEALAKAS